MFSHLLVDSIGVADNSLRLNGIKSNLIYYWRVKASDEWGTSGWSVTWWFMTGTVTGIAEKPAVPLKFGLSQNYPNPFNPTTVIEFGVPSSSFVSLKVYDVLGRVVRTLVGKVERPGIYKIEFNAADLPSGVYFYRIEFRSQKRSGIVFTKTMKLMFLK